MGVTKFGPTHLIEARHLLRLHHLYILYRRGFLHAHLKHQLCAAKEALFASAEAIIGQLPSIRHDLPKPLSSDEITSSTTWYVLIWKGVGSDRGRRRWGTCHHRERSFWVDERRMMGSVRTASRRSRRRMSALIFVRSRIHHSDGGESGDRRRGEGSRPSSCTSHRQGNEPNKTNLDRQLGPQITILLQIARNDSFILYN